MKAFAQTDAVYKEPVLTGEMALQMAVKLIVKLVKTVLQLR